MKNVDLRKYARSKKVSLWQIAQAIGISEPTMTRKLRRELSSEEKDVMYRIIDKIASEPS